MVAQSVPSESAVIQKLDNFVADNQSLLQKINLPNVDQKITLPKYGSNFEEGPLKAVLLEQQARDIAANPPAQKASIESYYKDVIQKAGERIDHFTSGSGSAKTLSDDLKNICQTPAPAGVTVSAIDEKKINEELSGLQRTLDSQITNNKILTNNYLAALELGYANNNALSNMFVPADNIINEKEVLEGPKAAEAASGSARFQDKLEDLMEAKEKYFKSPLYKDHRVYRSEDGSYRPTGKLDTPEDYLKGWKATFECMRMQSKDPNGGNAVTLSYTAVDLLKTPQDIRHYLDGMLEAAKLAGVVPKFDEQTRDQLMTLRDKSSSKLLGKEMSDLTKEIDLLFEKEKRLGIAAIKKGPIEQDKKKMEAEINDSITTLNAQPKSPGGVANSSGIHAVLGQPDNKTYEDKPVAEKIQLIEAKIADLHKNVAEINTAVQRVGAHVDSMNTILNFGIENKVRNQDQFIQHDSYPERLKNLQNNSSESIENVKHTVEYLKVALEEIKTKAAAPGAVALTPDQTTKIGELQTKGLAGLETATKDTSSQKDAMDKKLTEFNSDVVKHQTPASPGRNP